MKSILSAEHIFKSYGERNVVSDVSLTLTSGEVVGILGPNGSGKTTTFYSIVGLTSIDSGTVAIDHEDISKKPMHIRAQRGLGYLPQESSIFRNLTVIDNLRVVAEYVLPSEKINSTIEQLLKKFRIDHLSQQKAYTLSGGERRRLEIARTLITQPKFILLDEPFSGIDPISISEIQEIIKNLKQEEIGILITDHNVRETLNIVDRAYLIYEGRVLYSGNSSDILQDPNCRRLYLGKSFSL